MKARYFVTALVPLVLGAPLVAVSQERDTAREERVREAERQLEEARRALEQAIQQLRLHEDDARRSVERAIRQLRGTERQLAREQFPGEFRDIVVLPGDRAGRALVRVFGDDRARMGVILESDDDPTTDSVGASLQAVTPGGPADEAGLRAGDVVVRVDGESLGRTDRVGERPGEKLARIVRQHEEGDTLAIEYRRSAQTRNAKVVLRRLGPNASGFGWTGDSTEFRFDTSRLPRFRVDDLEIDPRMGVGPLHILMPARWLDMELVTLNDELGSYFGTTEGLLVVRAPSESSLNLRSGDVILSVDGRDPTSPSHALRIMRSYEPGESMRIEIMRNKRRTTVTATVPERE